MAIKSRKSEDHLHTSVILARISSFDIFKQLWREKKGEDVGEFVIHSTYKRLIIGGTKPSTFFHEYEENRKD